MMKTLGDILFSVLFLLVTFFGIGPVLLADGSMSERIITLVIVIIIYIILIVLFRYWRKKIRMSRVEK